MEKCQRCQNKEASLQCMNCTSFRNLCQTCDTFVHSLPTKKNHNRLLVNSLLTGENTRLQSQFLSNENTERLFNEQKDDCCNEHEKYIPQNFDDKNENLLSSNNPNDNLNKNNNIYNPCDEILKNKNYNPCDEILKNKNYNPCDEILKNSNPNDNQNLNDEKLKEIKIEKLNLPNQKNTLSTQPNSTILNSKFYYADNYSKDYVNELKHLFKKEKDELEFKNKTLQNNLDALKYKFSEQMNELTKELEDIQRKNKITLDTLKNNYEQKLNQLNNEHQIEIESLKNDIENLEEREKELKNKYENDLSEKKDLILKLNDKIEDLQNNLSQKTEENYKMKNSFDLMTKQYEDKFNDDKNKLIKEYEDKINNIVDNVECTKNKLLKLIDDREFDIKNILESKKTEINKLIEENNKLKEEVQCHKLNVNKIKEERDCLANLNEQLKKNECQYQCDNQMNNNEINKLNEEIRKLCEENNDLKCQITKLDKLIYGKIKPTFKIYNQNNC